MITAGMRTTGMHELVDAGPLTRFQGELELRQRTAPSASLKMKVSVLRQLVRAEILTDENIESLMADVGTLMERFDGHLKQRGNKDLRTPRSRLRALVDDYRATMPDLDELSFDEVFRAYIRARYGELAQSKGRWTDGVTLTHVARDIVAHWQKDGLVDAEITRNRSKQWARTIGRWYRGRQHKRGGIPARKKYHAHIVSLESFLGVPDGALVTRLGADTVDYDGFGAAPGFTHRRKLDKLPTAVDKLAKVYAAYRLHGRQPKIVHYPVSVQSAADRRRFRLYDADSAQRTGWTLGPLGDCRSEILFRSMLASYYSYLMFECEGEDIDPESEELPALLTDPDMLMNYADFIMERTVGVQNAQRLLSFISRGIADGGFLRHCVKAPKDVDTETWFRSLDELGPFIQMLKQELQRVDRGYKVDPKRNIRFLLAMKTGEAHAFLNQMSHCAFDLARKKRKSGRFHLSQAMRVSHIGLLIQLMRVAPLRAINWQEMHYIDDDTKNDLTRAAISFMPRTGRYRLFIPKESLKNRSRKGIEAVDFVLPENLNRLIEEYLSIRRRFIEKVLRKNASDIAEFTVCEPRGEGSYRLASTSLSSRFAAVTYGILQRLGEQRQHRGINIHAMRHLMATLYLRENPGDYVALATLLHDSLDVVLKQYAEVENHHQHERIAKWAESHA